MNKLIPKAVADSEKGMILAIADIQNTPEKIFEALTTDEVEKWWGEDGIYHIKDWVADLRVDGKWSLMVERPDGSTLPASGRFITVAPPNKISFTRRYDWDYPILGRRDTTVTYFLDLIDELTRLTIRHEGFGDATFAAYEHAEGWERFLSWLTNYMEKK